MKRSKRSVGFVGGYLKTSVGLGLGASVVGALPPTSVTPGVNAGLGAFGSFLPTLGTIGGASLALQGLKGLQKQARRFK